MFWRYHFICTPWQFLLAVSILAMAPPLQAQQKNKETAEQRVDSHGDPLPDGAVARLGTERLCRERVYFLAFAPDGKRLVTIADEGKLQVWEVNSGKQLRQWNVPRYYGYSPSMSPLAISPDNRWVAVACYDKTVRVWEMDTGKEILNQGQGVGGVVAFAPDSKSLATISGNIVRVVDVTSGVQTHRLDGSKYLNHVAFAADGKTVVAVGHEKPDRKVLTIHRWNALTGTALENHSVEFLSNFASRLSPDGRYLAIPEPDRTVIRRWDTKTGKELPPTQGKASYPGLLAFAADGNTLTCLSKDDRLRIWESASGKLLREFGDKVGELERVALSADGKILAATTRKDHGLHLWHVENGKKMHAFEGHRSGPLAVAFAPDGKSVLTTSRDSSFSGTRPGMEWSLRRWDHRTGKELQFFREDPERETRRVVFSPHGHFLAFANSSGILRMLNTADAKEAKRWKLDTQVITSIAGKEKKQYDSLSVERMGFSPDGATFAAASRGKITLYECATGKQIREIARPDGSFAQFAFFPDGKSLLVGDWSGGLYALAQVDVKTGVDVRKFPNIRTVTDAVAVAPTGRTAAKISRPMLTLYEVLTLEERASVNLDASTFALIYSLDGRWIVIGGRDGVVRIWDATTGRSICQLTGHNGEVNALAMSADSRWLVSTAENSALVWDLEIVLREHRPASVKLADAEMERLWRGLGMAKADEAAAAVARLALGGEQAAKFLHKQLKNPNGLGVTQIDKWIADLNSDQFAVRDNATRELRSVGNLAAPGLKIALHKAPSIEAKRRIEMLLGELSAPPSAWLQANRAMEVLELIGDFSARTAFEHLAKEAPDEWMRLEATKALERLERIARPRR